jgi:hydroxyacylglutathione hydrolase
MAVEIVPVPLLEDNYAYLIVAGEFAVVVDPSEGAPIEDRLKAGGLNLIGVLNTHHHGDHTGGNDRLKTNTGCRVFGPRGERKRIPSLDEEVSNGDRFTVGGVEFHVMGVPGHTRTGVAYYCPDLSAVFTGDTLFLMGCGRLFEGTAGEMTESLKSLAALPSETRLYCGHEYTKKNTEFCQSVFPNDGAIQDRFLKMKPGITVPGTIAEERANNPFLRVQDPSFRGLYFPGLDAESAFASLRRQKDTFG